MLVQYKNNNVLMTQIEEGAPILRILPGVNEVTDADWNKVRSTLSTKIDDGMLLEIGTVTKKGDKEVVSPKKFHDFVAAEAVAIVGETYDVELLEKWRKLEKRDEVRLAIVNQIEEMKKRPEEKEAK